MVFFKIYNFFYFINDYISNFFNIFMFNHFFIKKYITKNSSFDSNYSDISLDFDNYFYIDDKVSNKKNNNNLTCKKCNFKLNNEIYLFNDYCFCSKFCRKHYSYKFD